MTPTVCQHCHGVSPRGRRLCSSCYCRAWRAGTLPDVPPRRTPDEVVIERLIDGLPVPATTAERLQAALTLTQRGYSARIIAERIRVTPRTVTRYRGKARAA